MGFMTIHGYCAACGRFIVFNPDRVPSLRVDGERQPICQSCHAEWNRIHRLAKGLDPAPLHPDAYEPEEV